jgi:hypothetical protein
MMPQRFPSLQAAQRGAASLAVVMVLFLVMALVAGYTGRNLIFEQRTGANQWRSTQAVEVAQAGLDWAIAQLNSGRITDACTASALDTDLSFRQRYLSIDPNTGRINRLLPPAAPPDDSVGYWPSCVATENGWTCACPDEEAPNQVPAKSASSEVRPGFRVRFLNGPVDTPGTVRIEVAGCTRLSHPADRDDCLFFINPSTALAASSAEAQPDGKAIVSALVALKSGLAVPPGVPVLVRTSASGSAEITNSDVPSGGFTVQAGGAVTIPEEDLFSIPGVPAGRSILDADPTLADGALPADPFPIGDRMFAQTFTLWPGLYREQPGTLVIDCPGGVCNDAQVRAAARMNPGRPLWVAGRLEVSTAGDIGGPAAPVVLVVQGDVLFNTAATVHGVIYGGRSAAAPGVSWTLTGPGTISGAVVAEHAFAGVGGPVVRFSREVIDHLRLQTGTFVMVPGSWKDFPCVNLDCTR